MPSRTGTGIRRSRGDSIALRAALERLLGDGAERVRLGTAARRVARERLAWTTTSEALVDAYEDALRV